MIDPAPTLAQAVAQLGLCLRAGEVEPDVVISGAIVSDLLSFVMANGKPGNVWVTIQTHPNVVAVAVLAQLAAIIVASGFEPEADTAARAEEEGIPVLVTQQSVFTVAGQLYEMGVR